MSKMYYVIWYDRNKSKAVKVEEYGTFDEAFDVHMKALRAETADGPTVSLVGAEDRESLEKQFYAFFHKG